MTIVEQPGLHGSVIYSVCKEVAVIRYSLDSLRRKKGGLFSPFMQIFGLYINYFFLQRDVQIALCIFFYSDLNIFKGRGGGLTPIETLSA